MDNALHESQTIVVLGGASDIGLAVAKRLTTSMTKHIVLAVRDVGKGAHAGRNAGLPADKVAVEAFDAADAASHAAFIARLAATYGDLDVVVMAFGVLGDQAAFDENPAEAAAAVNVNYGGAVSSGLAVAAQLRTQGHGALVVLSSVAGERVRKANFVYGSSKAGMDAFAQGLGDSLVGSGARVVIVRPGFVHSAMTEGMKAAPFSTTPNKVAAATATALAKGRRVVWVPGILRFVFMAFRHLPTAVWRRLPLG